MNDKQLQLVTYEQAKKLKELGFDLKTSDCFVDVSDGCSNLSEENTPYDWNDEDSPISENCLSAPTVALALKFCIEKLRDRKLQKEIDIIQIIEKQLSELLDELIKILEQ